MTAQVFVTAGVSRPTRVVVRPGEDDEAECRLEPGESREFSFGDGVDLLVHEIDEPAPAVVSNDPP